MAITVVAPMANTSHAVLKSNGWAEDMTCGALRTSKSGGVLFFEAHIKMSIGCIMMYLYISIPIYIYIYILYIYYIYI